MDERGRGWGARRLRTVLIALVVVGGGVGAQDRAEIKQLASDLGSKDVETRFRAAQRLWKIGPAAKGAASALVKALGDSEWAVADRAMKALKTMVADVAPALVKGLKSKSPGVRRGAAELLVESKTRETKLLRGLVAALGDDDPATRGFLATTIAHYGADAVKPLVRALGTRDELQRDGVARALAGIGAGPTLPALRKALGGRSRAGAVLTLGYLGEAAAPAIPELLPALSDKDLEVRSGAARALGRIAEEAETVVPALVAALPGTRAAAEDALVDFGSAAAELLVPTLIETKSEVRDGIVAALARIAEGAELVVRVGTTAADPRVRSGCFDAVARTHLFVRYRPELFTTGFGDQKPEVRRAALLAALERGVLPCDALLKRLEDDDAGVRAMAARALGFVQKQDGGIVPALEAKRKDADARVRIEVEMALWGQRGGPPPIAFVRGFLKPDGPGVTAAEAVGRMGPLAAAAVPELTGLLAAERAPVRRAAALALARVAASDGLHGRAERYAKAPAKRRKEIERALVWLAGHQDTKKSGINEADGRWDPRDFYKHHTKQAKDSGHRAYAPGVTGLAALCFLAVGRDTPELREGLDFLLAAQHPEGRVGTNKVQHYVPSHALAALALVEGWAVTGEPRYRVGAQRALRFLGDLRRPGRGWRYDPRGEESDTEVTMLAVQALRLGELAGLEIDPRHLAAGLRWVEEMTDPDFGAVGYSMRGGGPARPEGLVERFPPEHSQSMVAAGLWVRLLAGGAPRKVREFPLGLQLMTETLPTWAAGRTDFYYWHFGSLVAGEVGGRFESAWTAALEGALLPALTADGAWPAVGPWCPDGGGVYATAINLLSLLTPYRFESGFLSRPSAARDVVQALEKAADDDEFLVRAAAREALRVILRR